MEDATFIAHLQASYVANETLSANAYNNVGKSIWERSALDRALTHYDKLAEAMTAVRARLAELNQPAEVAA